MFFVRTPEDFLAFTRARKPDPQTGQPDLAKIGKFLEAHPEALPAIQAALGAKVPASYLKCTYNALHAFRLVNAAREGTWVRWTLEPDTPGDRLEPEDAAARDPDYLQSELADRLVAAPAGFTLIATIALEGDPLDDPTAAWPQQRERVPVGRLELTGLAFDREQDGDILVFDPTRVVDGIECSDDPILHARSWAYGVGAPADRGAARVLTYGAPMSHPDHCRTRHAADRARRGLAEPGDAGARRRRGYRATYPTLPRTTLAPR